MKAEMVKELFAVLALRYPDPKPELNYQNSFQLLIATMLSAQSTDKQVNRITEKLFRKYPCPEDYVGLSPEQLEQDIRGCGLYKNKAKNIIATCQLLVDQFGSEVPPSREHLMSLPGVGRKTANVVLANAFGIPAFAVDTHVFRVANRLGLAVSENVLDTEQQLMAVTPTRQWSDAHHWLLFLGRYTCQAKKPKCAECPVQHLCQSHKL
ncbi:MAG TPA: endonuclease III [Bacillota bacterium]|nr:endonuclease III [Bacillota bacterium]